MSTATTVATTKVWLVRIRGGRMGSAARRSTGTRAAQEAAVASPRPMVIGLDHA